MKIISLLKNLSTALFTPSPRVDTPPSDPQKVADLSIEFIFAAGNNDVSEMKRLRSKGADIDFKANITLGSGTICFGPQGVSQPEETTNALMVALHNGSFDAALYLAQTGAEATAGRKEVFGNREQKALDFLLTARVPESAQETPSSMADIKAFIDDAYNKESSERRHKNYQTDLYTPTQRIQLFDALVANMQEKGLNPLDLVSEWTMDNTLTWGRSEMVPKLAEIGVEIKDAHFVSAADPYHRPHLAIAMMEAVLPYVKDVNVTDRSKQNAGHEVAGKFDLPAFKWLEQRGLAKDAIAKLNVPTYAHMVAGCFGNNNNAEEAGKRKAFAQYLADQKYPINVRDQEYSQRTPIETAFSEGNIDVGLIYVEAGAEVKSGYLAEAIKARHFNKVSTPQILNLIDKLEERGVLDQESLQMAFDELAEKVEMNDKNRPLMLPVLKTMLAKGLTLEPEKQQIANKILTGQALEAKDRELARSDAFNRRMHLPTNDL
ncbi:MAG: hypothetical protein WC612_04610 [Bdellovibrionales bacterium]|jgi:hypothetical protein